MGSAYRLTVRFGPALSVRADVVVRTAISGAVIPSYECCLMILAVPGRGVPLKREGGRAEPGRD